MEESLAELEARTLNEDDSAEIPPTDIVAYNELRSCADLHRMYEQGILEIQPDFQRDIVWKGPDQTRFIDSLIKQLPIPSMCFALDHKAQRWIDVTPSSVAQGFGVFRHFNVLDGQLLCVLGWR